MRIKTAFLISALIAIGVAAMLPTTAAYAKSRAVLPPMVFGTHRISALELQLLIAANK